MKIIFTFLVILTITSVHAQGEELDSEAYKQLQKIDKNDFGQTLMDTIQIQLTSGDAVSNLIDLLRGMEQDLVQEQSEDDKYIMDLQTSCDEELNRLQGDVQASQQRIAELQNELGEKVPLKDQKQTSLERKQNFLNLLNARKSLKDQEWAEEQEQHNVAESAIVRAKQIVEESLQNSQSFLEKKSGTPDNTIFAQVSSTITNSLKQYSFKRKGWKSIFEMLAEVASSQDVQADSDAVKKIVEICDDILDKIAESREIERQDYKHWVDEYQTTFDKLEERATGTQAEMSDLQASITTLTKRINMAKDEKSEQEERVDQKTKQHDDREQWCDDENLNYGKRRQGRDDNREVISNAISLLMSKLRTFRKYVGDRTITAR